METKFTGGDWRRVKGICQMADFGTTIHHRGCHGVYSDADEHGDDEADANLISASPRMFVALQSFVNFARDRRQELGALSPEMEEIEALAIVALAKATGASHD